MMTGIKLVYIEDLGSTVYSASFWTLMIVASSSDIGLILFWTWLIVASSSDIGLILFCNSSIWGLSCLVVITARTPKVWPPLINSHSFMQRYLTNQKSRRVSSWLLIGLNLHERMGINQSGHTSGLFAVKAKNCYTNWFLATIKWGPARGRGGSHVAHLNLITSRVVVYKCLSPIVGFAVTVAIWPREVVAYRDFILRDVATFWAMLLVRSYPSRAS